MEAGINKISPHLAPHFQNIITSQSGLQKVCKWLSLKSYSGLLLSADFIEHASVIFRIDPALLSLEKRLQKPQITEQLESGRDPAAKGGRMANFFTPVCQSMHTQPVKVASEHQAHKQKLIGI